MFDKVEKTERTERLVRKWKVDDLRAIDRNESWFSDMAEQGLFLESVGRYFVKFREGTPRHVRYRIDVLPRELTEDELSLYDSCGWHYVTMERSANGVLSARLYLYIFETQESAALPELHTDPMEQAESLRRLNRQSVCDLWLTILMVALGIGLPTLLYLHNSDGFYWIAKSELLFPLLPLCILGVMETLRRWRTTRRLWQRLKNGNPLNHRADYRVSRRWYLLLNNGILVLIVAYFTLQLGASIFGDQYRGQPLSEGVKDFPAVRLTGLRGTVREDEIIGYSTHEWTNANAVVDEIWEYGDYEEDGAQIELSTVCYRLPFTWTSTLAFDALLDDGFYEGIHENYYVGEITPVSTDLVDEAWAAAPAGDNGGRFALFVRDGRYIVQTFYSDHTTDFSGDPDAAAAYRDRCVERILPLLVRRLDG